MNQPQHKSKNRTAVWLYPETIVKMDSMLETGNSKSRSEFIEKALQFYMEYLTSENTAEYLPKVLVSAMQGILRETENRNSSNLFRLSQILGCLYRVLIHKNNNCNSWEN